MPVKQRYFGGKQVIAVVISLRFVTKLTLLHARFLERFPFTKNFRKLPGKGPDPAPI